MATKCQARNQAGKPCSALAVDGVHCPWHATGPEWVERRREWSAKGGANKSNRNRAKKAIGDSLTPDELAGVLSRAIYDVLSGQLNAGPAQAVAALARTLLAVRDAAELEVRLAALEAAAGIGRKPA